METIIRNFDLNVTMTGKEKYPILGDEIELENLERIMSMLMGLPLYAGCLEKARVIQPMIPESIIAMGELIVHNGDFSASYSYEFNPPLEFHAWVQTKKSIIDFGLPGTILRGINTRDEIGPYLEGRNPVILAGMPPDWLRYTPHKRVM